MLTFVVEPNDAGHKTCFVVMPVTTPSSYVDELRDVDHFSHVLKHLFKPALERMGYTVIPPKMLGAALIHAEIISQLEQADLVLADLSNHNPNVFFELGIRTSLDRPVVLVKDVQTAVIPFDLGPINVLTYDESLATWTLDEEIERLAEHVGNVPVESSSGNAMWRYFGLTKRGGPADAGSLEAKVDLLLAETTNLRLISRVSTLEVDSAGTRRDHVDTALILGNWELILSTVKEARRVGWILLQNVVVEAVASGALTLLFRKDGDAKGFITTDCAFTLGEAIHKVVNITPDFIIAKGPTIAYRVATSAEAAATEAASHYAGLDEPPF